MSNVLVHISSQSQCMDLCMQRQNADLATASAARWWTARVHSRQVVSAGGGPPCETFTIARTHNNDGPRPLRFADHPQGLPGLTRKEWPQVHISDKLLRFFLEMLLALAANGLSGFLEHPQYPTWLQSVSSASIWMLDIIRIMNQMHRVSIISFDQCTCGALGRKPTRLLLVCLPEVRHRLLLQGDWGRCHHPPGHHGPLISRQSHGTFHTGKAKIYPEGMNDIIGTAMFRFASNSQTVTWTSSFRRSLSLISNKASMPTILYNEISMAGSFHVKVALDTAQRCQVLVRLSCTDMQETNCLTGRAE